LGTNCFGKPEGGVAYIGTYVEYKITKFRFHDGSVSILLDYEGAN